MTPHSDQPHADQSPSDTSGADDEPLSWQPYDGSLTAAAAAADPAAVHLWSLRLARPSDQQLAAKRWLTAAEQRRADRFKRPTDRRAFALTRATLRGLLAGYLAEFGAPVDPDHLQITSGDHGKPAVSSTQQPAAGPGVEFNVSHSADIALIAVAVGRPVGVDVESVDRRQNLAAIAEHHFRAAESAHILAADGQKRRRRFYRCWTRKEAYLKAVGDGLAGDLQAFEVSAAAGPSRLVWAEHDDPEAVHFADADPAGGYVGAVCVRQRRRLRVLLRTVGRG